MDDRRVTVGVVTNYNIYLVILRTAIDHIVVSSPIIRKLSLRLTLEEPFTNQMSVYELLLSLLLHSARPERVEITAKEKGLWKGLFVREPVEKASGGKRKRGDDGSGGSSRKRGGERKDGGEVRDQAEGGDASEGSQSGEGEQVNDDSAGRENVRTTPRRSDESNTSPVSGAPTLIASSPTIDLSAPSSTMIPPNAKSTMPTPTLRFTATSPELRRIMRTDEIEWMEGSTFFLADPPSIDLMDECCSELELVLDELLMQGDRFITYSALARVVGHVKDPDIQSRHDNNNQDIHANHEQGIHEVKHTDHPEYSYKINDDSSSDIANVQTSPSLFGSRHGFIVKLADLHTREHQIELDLPDPTTIRHAIRNEIRALTGPLADLQGVSVPRCYGSWISSGGWAVVLLEKVEGVAKGWADMNEADR